MTEDEINEKKDEFKENYILYKKIQESMTKHFINSLSSVFTHVMQDESLGIKIDIDIHSSIMHSCGGTNSCAH